jgi:hypothetical protein
MRRVFVLALSLTILLPLLTVLLAFAAASSQAQCGGGGAVGPGSAPGVPTNLLAIYEQAAGSYQLGPSGWAYLAAINQIETNFGHNLSVSSRGAIGWMQFMPATWAQYQVSADPANPGAPPDPDDPWDAILTAARYLNASGAPSDWQAALYAYNHAGWYVAQTQQLAQHYAQTTGTAAPTVGGVPQPGCVTAGPTTPGATARILPDGLAAAPLNAPGQVAGRDRGRGPNHRHLLQHRTHPEHAHHREGLLRLLGLDRLRARPGRAQHAGRHRRRDRRRTRECSKATAIPAPATGSPSTPPPDTRSSRSPGSRSTPPTGQTRQPSRPAADPAGNPPRSSPPNSPTATRGPNDTPQDYETTCQPENAQALDAGRHGSARDRVRRHPTGRKPHRQARRRRDAYHAGDRQPAAGTPTQRPARPAASGRDHRRARVRPLPREPAIGPAAAHAIPTDPDTLIAPNPPAAPPTGPAAARPAALGFTQSYLAYTYGHVAARQLRDLTPALQAAIAANPPVVPPAIRALHPRISSVALTRDRARWMAAANVTDGQSTYQVTSVLARIRGDWLAVGLKSAG